MATGQLGKAARISYESKNQKSGLTDIVLTVQRPDGVDLGPFPMLEYRPGFYKHDFITALTDQEGDYLGFITSPSEPNNLHVKVSLFKPGGGSGGGEVSILDCDPLIGKIKPLKLIGVARKIEPLKGVISSSKVIGKTIDVKPLIGKIKDVKIKGVVEKEC